MDMNYLDKMYEELTALGEVYKHHRRKTKVNIIDKEVCHEYIKRNPDTSITDESQLARVYILYKAYLDEKDSKKQKCMHKALASQSNIKNIKMLFGKISLVSDSILDDILSDRMSMHKLKNLRIEIISPKDRINPNHLKDDSKITIDDRIILSQLQCDVESFLDSIKLTASMAKSNGVHNIPDYKDICAEMLGSISETMRSFDTLIA